MKIGIKIHEITQTLVLTIERYCDNSNLITTCKQDIILHLFFLSQGGRFEKGQKGEQGVVEPVSAGVSS